MSLNANKELILWGIALIQPCSAKDVQQLLSALYPDSGPVPTVENIKKGFEYLGRHSRISQVHAKAGLYSITERGHENISKKQRYLRDKMRLFLLKAAYDGKFSPQEELAQGLSGDSPGADISSGTKEVARPVGSAVIPRSRRGSLARNYGRAYWPRLLEQLDSPVGLSASSSDTLLSYYSFNTIADINDASKDGGPDKDITLTGLALAIGISPRLLGYLSFRPSRHYRRFEIGKRGGGTRVIRSPRVFLKTVQCWLKDYILWRLPLHQNCHAYVRGRSIVTNAQNHIGKAFVANMDIEDFFGSVSSGALEQNLLESGIGENLASCIVRLATLDDCLPQGAPTSPTLSNSYLYKFDEEIATVCEKADLSYSRYADDITISGSTRQSIEPLAAIVEKELSRFGLRINKKKTRIASQGGQQRVTGVVVNEHAQPPRTLRRRIRAMFHNASINPDAYRERMRELQGYLSYLNSFPHLRETEELEKYRDIIGALSRE